MPPRHPQHTNHPTFSEPVFNEDTDSNDPSDLAVFHANDSAIYDQVKQLLYSQVVGFDKSRLPDDQVLPLAQAWGAHGTDVVNAIQQSGQVVFHAVGDSGATKKAAFRDELHVFDHAAADIHSATTTAERPSFFYHLGDVVYDFGEIAYYYDQFYEPFRNYHAPVFAIPGNHDSFVIPKTATGTGQEYDPLTTFVRNFCAEAPQVTGESRSLHRTAQTQPGVYFSLDAPFVRIVGLFSNALEDPGVISSEGGTWPDVPDFQLAFLKAQLQRIKQEQYKGAVVLAMHHPPFSYAPQGQPAPGGSHGGSPNMLKQIDTICQDVGVYPHAVLSGHVHNYQRFTRSLRFGGKDIEVPFVLCGSGGHHINRIVQGTRGHPAQPPRPGDHVDYLDSGNVVESRGLVLANYDDDPADYGYLRVSVTAQRLRIAFQLTADDVPRSQSDGVTVDLATRRLVGR
jgi:Icc-related predicted phosphoesterase